VTKLSPHAETKILGFVHNVIEFWHCDFLEFVS